jgi:hypothetical protein
MANEKKKASAPKQDTTAVNRAAQEKEAAEKRAKALAEAIAADKEEQKKAAEKREAAKAAKEKALRESVDEKKKAADAEKARLGKLPRVAEGCALTSRRGVLGPGDPVKPGDFSKDKEADQETFDKWVNAGTVIPGAK